MARLASGLLVQALLRRVAAAGGAGSVLAKGDETAGGILISYCERGEVRDIVERVLNLDGAYRWSPVGPRPATDSDVVNDYFDRRRRFDPDLWIVELDIVGVERFAAELAAEG
jgi:hypothetical protein